jgi:hypothetical protein
MMTSSDISAAEMDIVDCDLSNLRVLPVSGGGLGVAGDPRHDLIVGLEKEHAIP